MSTYAEYTDGARIVALVLGFVVLVLLQRANHLFSSHWTTHAKFFHRFLTILVIALFLGGIEKIAIMAKPAIFPFAQCFVYLYGIFKFIEMRKHGDSHE